MNHFFNQLKNIKMTSAEKTRIRHTMVTLTKSRMSDYRSPAKRPVKSPMSGWHFATNFRTVGAAFLIFILASTGVSFAAEKTLPGDLLYPVKINVNEEVRGALIISSEGKMDWEKERVVRRVEETEILLKTDKFTPKRKLEAETALKAQMKTFATAAAETSEKNPNAVIAATAELEPALKVHQEVITNIASASDSKALETGNILSTVALGIAATSEQETVAIASAVTNAPEAFEELTNAKISGAEVAIDISDKIITKEEDIKTEAAKTDAANQTALIDPTTTKEMPVIEPMMLKTIEPATSADTKIDVKSDTKTDTKADVKTDEKSDTKEVVPAPEPAADATLMTLKAATPTVLDPKEVLANAKAKLAQAKVLREQGDLKGALTLAQEAYKDMVALKLQARIANKAKQIQSKTEVKKDSSETTPIKSEGEVKGVQTETTPTLKQ